jgi:putative heme-binding domain-containing protein
MVPMVHCRVLVVVALLSMPIGSFESTVFAQAQNLEADLLSVSPVELAAKSRELGDATRGAILFFQPTMACGKCHVSSGEVKENSNLLGPDLSALDKTTSDESLVESLLIPSKVIRKGFESVSILTADGKVLSAFLVEKTADKVIVRDVSRGGERITLDMAEVESITDNQQSIMPVGQVNQLASRQQFYDLVRYLMEIRDGGRERALQLQPSAALLTLKVPEYENHLDHAGLISSWNDESLKRGEAIYQRVCANCHGTKDQAGSLPTSLRFADGKFKNGHDPLSIYRTLTHGFGLMVPQTWMVPSQKYDVIHYLREVYLKTHNASQFSEVNSAYLQSLPKGDTFGPEPSKIEAWSAMDYGPSLAHTYEVPGGKHNFAYKGIAVRLDPGAGGVSRGRNWMIFDTDTLRTAAGWSSNNEKDGKNFIDWKGIQFNGEHQIHPKVIGSVAFSNSTGPGWANSSNGKFDDDARVLGRDGRQYGPLPRQWGRFKGVYHFDQQVILSYSVGTTNILELPRLVTFDDNKLPPLMIRTFNLGPRDRDLNLQVAENATSDTKLDKFDLIDNSVAILRSENDTPRADSPKPLVFDGNNYLESDKLDSYDLLGKDFSVVARVKTSSDGSIWSISEGGMNWSPDGQALFIRDGRLVFDIGWVGAITGKTKITDAKWHLVALTWDHQSKMARLFVDGKAEDQKTLSAKRSLKQGVVRVGFTAPDFPSADNSFDGEISHLRFYQRRLTDGLASIKALPLDDSVVVDWKLTGVHGKQLTDGTKKHQAAVCSIHDIEPPKNSPTVAGYTPYTIGAQWNTEAGNLRLRIPAGQEPLRFSVWLPADVNLDWLTANLGNEKALSALQLRIPEAQLDLEPMTKGGPARWPQRMTTETTVGQDNGPFAVDFLTAPESNPWLAQMRFTGLDFFDDGCIAVCSWDGDVWIVTPAASPSAPKLQWQRIASGLFQPLGLKILKGKIHLVCRDQLAVLHDLNADGEIDYYESLNNDHQVTEHFHEFAMGLQTDSEGNFYYAKSGCHAKSAVVPHHGTLLRVSQDGSKTEILANGFRAANGVCLNPDGSFFVTDQEGFWNPKNRINWVTTSTTGKPNFYGNMLGYHDVQDSSDLAMVQPLCWITNEFDRSPAELLWVDSKRWGPLDGALLNLSYGYGKVFVVPHQRVGDKMQGGMLELPIPLFPTGIMRGRFHPADEQLYLCGMFAWAGNATHPGGLYRLRATGKPMHLATGLNATQNGLTLTFTDAIDPSSLDPQNININTWSLKRTESYGSKHFDEQSLKVRNAKLSADRKSVTLDVEGLQPTWCMEIKYSIRSASGSAIEGKIHNTIHELP